MEWFKIVLSFSKNRSKIIEDLQSDKSNRFYDHILKIIACPNSEKLNHWTSELYSFCDWMQKTTIKPKNKPISKKLMMEYFFNFGETLEIFSKALDNTYIDYNHGNKRLDKTRDEMIYSNFKQFCNAVADSLVKMEMNSVRMGDLVRQYLVH